MEATQCRGLEELSRTIVSVLSDDSNLINIRTFVVASRYFSFKAAARFLIAC